MSVTLRDKFYGCICGAHIGSAMGAPVKGWPCEKTQEFYGTLDKLVPYEHYNNGWKREAGTTEDGVERQKLIISAIIEKGGRVNAEDVRRSWVRNTNPQAAGNISDRFEGDLYGIAKSIVPARDIGRYCDYANLATFAASAHPIGLINTGDIPAVIDDVLEVGQLYHKGKTRAMRWSCVVGVGIAMATKQDATVDSVLEALFDNLNERAGFMGEEENHADYAGMYLIDELKCALELTAGCKDHRGICNVLQYMYRGVAMPYSMSFANEVVTKGVCVFRMCGGNVEKAIVTAVNLGRDSSGIASVAAGLSGALSGAGSIPGDWIEQVDAATGRNPFTNSKRTLRECADGLYGAFQNKLDNYCRYAADMDIE